MTRAKLNKLINLANKAVAQASADCEAAIAKGGECGLMRLFWSQRPEATEADLELEAAIERREQAEKILEALRIFEASSVAVKVAYVPTSAKAAN